MGLSRRNFFKVGGATGMALALAGALEQESALAASGGNSQLGVLIDISRCIGCRTCEKACLEVNHLPPQTKLPGAYTLSGRQFSFVDKRQIDLGEKQTATRFVKRQCMHCLEPACVAVCPVGALRKAENGAVVYDDKKCIGCRYCMTACPFDVPRYEWESTAPLIRKCQFCTGNNVQGNQATACACACPSGAITTGPRSDLLAEAAARIKAEPARYVDYIYGKDEVGGTSVLYLSNVPFAELGFHTDLPAYPLPTRTEAVMSKLPALVLGLAVVLGSSAVLSGRTLRVPQPETAEAAEEGAQKP